MISWPLILCQDLSVHDCSDEVLVVDVPLVVLMASKQLFRLFITQLLAKSCQKMTQLGRRNKTIAILVEMTETLDKVLTEYKTKINVQW